MPTTVPLHRHEVSIDYTRVELEADYTFTHDWDAVLRVPYEIKAQDARVDLVGSATIAQQEAAARNFNIHHQDETHTSLGDLMLLAAHRKSNLFRDGDWLKVAFGTSVPTGTTEEDPFKAGDRGEEHLHIQFGTGTFDPLLELNYRTPLSPRFSLSGYALGRAPLYENSKTYQGPPEITSGLLVGYRPRDRLFLHLNGTLYYQGFAHWDGVRDESSGLVATSAMVGVTVGLTPGTSLGFDVRYPVSQRTLQEGDAFEQGPTFLFTISRLFRASETEAQTP